MATVLNADFNQLSSSICAIQGAIKEVGGQVGFSAERVINAVNAGAEDRVAWHAGKGEWANDEKYTNKMNHYAIGIEIAAIGSQKDMGIYLTEEEYAALDDRFKGFSDAQYDALKLLVEDICARYDIPADRDHVIGHQDYSPSKNDPGELFDWSRILPH